MMATSARAARSSGAAAGSSAESASSSQSERCGMGAMLGGVPLDRRDDLCRGVGRTGLGRLVEVDLDALPLVEMHRARLVRQLDVTHRALHVDARQYRDDVGGSDGARGLDGPLPRAELIPGQSLVDQGLMLVLLREDVLERLAHGCEMQGRRRERGPDRAHPELARGLPESLVDIV